MRPLQPLAAVLRRRQGLGQEPGEIVPAWLDDRRLRLRQQHTHGGWLVPHLGENVIAYQPTRRHQGGMPKMSCRACRLVRGLRASHYQQQSCSLHVSRVVSNASQCWFNSRAFCHPTPIYDPIMQAHIQMNCSPSRCFRDVPSWREAGSCQYRPPAKACRYRKGRGRSRLTPTPLQPSS